MKTIAKAAAGVALTVILAFTLFALTTRLKYTVSVTAIPASDNEEFFDEFRTDMTSGAFTGYVYETGVLGAASEYSFVTLTVNIKDPGLFPMEWVLLTPIQHDGDIACEISEAGPADLSGGESGTLTLTFLTSSPDAVRECGIEYYVFGKLQSAVAVAE